MYPRDRSIDRPPSAAVALILALVLPAAAHAVANTPQTKGASGWHWSRAQASVLVESLQAADRHGLDPEHYDAAALAAELAHGAAPDGADHARFSRALLSYASDLVRGRFDPAELDQEWHLPGGAADQDWLGRPQPPEPAVLRERLAELAPSTAAYRAMQDALARYREIAADGGWPVPGPGPWLREGDRHAQVAKVRERLAGEAFYLSCSPDPERFDATLAVALERFQRRHGLTVDAIVGPNTRAELNRDVRYRIDQLRANLERWRWLPDDLGDRYLLVNSAGHEIVMVRDGEVIYRSRAITGRPSRPTPSLLSDVTHVVFNPPWNVPYRLATHDLLPKQQKDPGYFDRERVRVFLRDDRDVEIDPATVDWQSLGHHDFPYALRQEPGPGNALGRLKFHMANPFNIYLHDTPKQALFEEASRAFSSGCIRVERPRELARLLLDEAARWDADAIDRRIADGDTDWVKIDRPVPVYVTYRTAWVDAENGHVQFRRDIYHNDEPLIAALRHSSPRAEALRFAGNFPPVADTPVH